MNWKHGLMLLPLLAVVVVKLFAFDWLPAWGQVLGVLAFGLTLVVGFALAGSLPLLRAKPAQALREL